MKKVTIYVNELELEALEDILTAKLPEHKWKECQIISLNLYEKLVKEYDNPKTR